MCGDLLRSLYTFTRYAVCRNVCAEGRCDASRPTSNSFMEWCKSGHNELKATVVFAFLEFAEKKWVGYSHAGIIVAQLSLRIGGHIFA